MSVADGTREVSRFPPWKRILLACSLVTLSLHLAWHSLENLHLSSLLGKNMSQERVVRAEPTRAEILIRENRVPIPDQANSQYNSAIYQIKRDLAAGNHKTMILLGECEPTRDELVLARLSADGFKVSYRERHGDETCMILVELPQ